MNIKKKKKIWAAGDKTNLEIFMTYTYLKSLKNLILSLDPMTFICNPDIDTLKIYLHTENEVCSLRHSKVIG